MKVNIVCGALLATSEGQRNLMPDLGPRPPRPQDAERRYVQLTDMMAFFNPDFDERKYWTYGCQCLMLGDRPMSDPGHGKPVDALDQVCKEYKDCLKCARLQHGDTCIGEFVKYRYRKTNRGEIQCKDRPEISPTSACKRSLCECDAAFARAHVGAKDVFDSEYHMFWSTKGWDVEDPDSCVRNPGSPHKPECCGTSKTPYVIYNAMNKKCCADGTVKTEC